ncbi:MAG: hypothetical protein J0I41_05180 [Filimonas sp.]|nr:hypothetical protein [Filimonas sp.]
MITENTSSEELWDIIHASSELQGDDELFNRLKHAVNYLIQHDFAGLIQVLYRIDISEQKLKDALAKNPGEDAGRIIATMIIERQKEKAKWKQQFAFKTEEIPEDEKW